MKNRNYSYDLNTFTKLTEARMDLGNCWSQVCGWVHAFPVDRSHGEIVHAMADRL